MTQTHQIYDGFDPAKGYHRIPFRADRVLQSRELNALQSEMHHRVRGIADVLFKEGGIIRQAGIVVNQANGDTLCESGAVYLDGAVRGVPTGAINVPTVGVVYVGVYVTRTIVTELEDPSLLNPAVGTPSYNKPGAARERFDVIWGYRGDGQSGDFYPIWTVEDGWVRPKEPPPNLDAVTQALARYDRDSAGGSYIVRGLGLLQGADLPSGEQVYTLAEGAARVTGYGLEQPSARRMVYNAAPDLLWIDSEPHQSTTEASQHVQFDRWPMVGVPQVRIVSRKTVQVVHGGHTGAADPLPDTSVLVIEQVKQGVSLFNIPADCKLTAGQVDWSPEGQEPTPGSTYEVTYQYVRVVEPSNVEPRGFDVEGAIVGSLITVSYNHALRRIDRLCISADGDIAWVRGVSAQWQPVPPVVPQGTLCLASVYQTWDSARRVVPDGVRVVPMQDIAAYRTLLDRIREDQAELRLAVDISGRHSGIKKGLFADPMLNNSMRDAGIVQTGAIIGGALRLPMVIALHQIGKAVTERQVPAHTHKPALSQPMRTGSMLVNPYMAFDPLPRAVVLKPAVDRWTETHTQWANPVTKIVFTGSTHDEENLLSEKITDIAFLRQILIEFELDFGPGEQLTSSTFGGIAVVAEPLAGGTLLGNAQGKLKGTIDIPANVPAGTHMVEFRGSGGSYGDALFTGQGTLIEREQQQVHIIRQVAVDPLAQTFSMQTPRQCTGVNLWFTAKGDSEILVQLREADNGFPTQRVLSETRLKPAAIKVDGTPTQVTWPPVVIDGGREYALVALCDDAVTALAVAELGAFDLHSVRWVTSQPYQVGVLLSSSNASTWTAHQDRDLTFELLVAEFTETERLIDLGTVQVLDATDLMVQAFVHQPSVASSGSFLLTLAGADPIEVAPGQVATLAHRYTGAVQVKARLRGSNTLAAMLEPGMQLVAASVQSTGDYVSPMINAGGVVRVRAVVEVNMPAGSAVQIHAQSDAPGAPWVEVPYLSSSPQTAGVFELTYELENYTADRLRLRVTSVGSHTARPEVRNLRAVVL